MTYEEVLAYCGGTGYKIAQTLKVSMATPCHWKAQGFIPIVAQMRIEKLTGRKLRADLNHCEPTNDVIDQ
jgi:hypothetical protein